MADHDTTGTGGPPPMRIGDADRQRMIDMLQKHMGAGRLDIDEFERRVEHASGAIYDRDLDGLLDDLPLLDADEAATRRGDGRDDGRATGRAPRRAPRDPFGWWPPGTRGSDRPPWAWRGGVPAPLLVLAAVALVAVTHGWILFPLLFLFLASGRGPCNSGRHRGQHRGHGNHGHHGHHGRSGQDRGGPGTRDGRDHGPRWDDESVWDEPTTDGPTWPGRYDPDRDDRIV